LGRCGGGGGGEEDLDAAPVVDFTALQEDEEVVVVVVIVVAVVVVDRTVVAPAGAVVELRDVELAGIFEARSRFLADTEWSCFFLTPAPAVADVEEAEDEDALLRCVLAAIKCWSRRRLVSASSPRSTATSSWACWMSPSIRAASSLFSSTILRNLACKTQTHYHLFLWYCKQRFQNSLIQEEGLHGWGLITRLLSPP
jgi:hypothetical protein